MNGLSEAVAPDDNGSCAAAAAPANALTSRMAEEAQVLPGGSRIFELITTFRHGEILRGSFDTIPSFIALQCILFHLAAVRSVGLGVSSGQQQKTLKTEGNVDKLTRGGTGVGGAGSGSGSWWAPGGLNRAFGGPAAHCTLLS
ncbi:hypothetical protein E2C01_011655 [Portunus trituberculatus]|uniref:Uncharacterized protein n=1 Tax=Portunus trituberculatus TaxID=210409 RepID=A0A5B7DBP0_PORTR|nr:hypothetical protein [Portunus trituberculatus]